MSTLRDRCNEILAQMQRDFALCQGSPVDTLEAFVIAEKGRSADPALYNSSPLCLYFKNAKEREEFIEAFRRAKPDMNTKKLP